MLRRYGLHPSGACFIVHNWQHVKCATAIAADGEGDEDEASFVGAAVIAAGPDAVRHIEWLLSRGAEEVLVLPGGVPAPRPSMASGSMAVGNCQIVRINP